MLLVSGRRATSEGESSCEVKIWLEVLKIIMKEIILSNYDVFEWTDIFAFFPIEKPVWYFEGWRPSACIASPSSAAPIFKAAQTPWLISTAGAKRVDLPATRGTALYMTVAPHAWKSSFLCSVTLTATPNFDERWNQWWAVLFCKMTRMIDKLL